VGGWGERGKQQPPPQTSVSLKSILVRTSAFTSNVSVAKGGAIPAGAWTDTPPALVLDPTNPSFDFELVLTGAAPSGGFPVTVTAVATAPAAPGAFTKASVTLASGPYVVAEGETDSPAYVGNVVAGPVRFTTTVTITATANDDSSNVVTATVTLAIP
jgi:hypothetical protein